MKRCLFCGNERTKRFGLGKGTGMSCVHCYFQWFPHDAWDGGWVMSYRRIGTPRYPRWTRVPKGLLAVFGRV